MTGIVAITIRTAQQLQRRQNASQVSREQSVLDVVA